MVTIRKFVINDIEFVLNNWVGTDKLGGYWKDATKESLTKSFADWDSEIDIQGRPRVKYCIEITENGRKIPVGVIYYSYNEEGCLTYNIFIDENYRGKGYAVQATKLAEEKLKEKGIKIVKSSSFHKNIASINLHKKVGFVLIKQEINPAGNLMYRWEKHL